MVVAVIGLVVNIICALVLHDKSGDGDYNRRSAYLHVLADALTSIGAIFGLICAMIWNIIWIDSLVALICSIVIVRWAIGMLWNTGKALTAKTSPNSQRPKPNFSSHRLGSLGTGLKEGHVLTNASLANSSCSIILFTGCPLFHRLSPVPLFS